jgi:glycosyltransferase involved in cell wall biosynthesis
MRQLLPTIFYPGRKRVGVDLTQLDYEPSVRVFNGVDWYWLPTIFRSLAFLIRERPNVVVFQWWTSTVLHSYFLIALFTRLLRLQVVIEFHEVLDTGEAKLPIVQAYVQLIAPLIIRLAHGFVVHSEYDRKLLQKHYNLEKRPIVLIPHGPYNHCHLLGKEQEDQDGLSSDYNLLFFGVIRPYKGLEDLIMAFNTLPESEIDKYKLTVVGETWEGWNIPKDLIEQSPYRDRITFVNRYVSDAEVMQFFAEADAVVLPYHRSSTSGPLHIAMSCGLPVVVTKVGGMVESVENYDGAILVSPRDIVSLQQALLEVGKLCGRRYTDPHSWEYSASSYQKLFDTIEASDHPVRLKLEDLALVGRHIQRQEVPESR